MKKNSYRSFFPLLVFSVLCFTSSYGAQTNITQRSLAYNSEATKRMLEEINYHALKLSLPTPRPIQLADLKPNWYLRPPRMGFGGVLATTNFMFVFYTNRKLDQIRRTDLHDERFDLYPIWAKTRSLVDTNGAYQLATQWLTSVSVDVPALQKKYPLSFYQWFYWGREAGVPDSELTQYPPTTNKVLMPIYDVKWGDQSSPAVKVTVFGPTKELLVLEMNDISFSRRPPIVISNWQELLNIPDPPRKQLVPPSPATSTNANTSHSESNRPVPFRQRVGRN